MEQFYKGYRVISYISEGREVFEVRGCEYDQGRAGVLHGKGTGGIAFGLLWVDSNLPDIQERTMSSVRSQQRRESALLKQGWRFRYAKDSAQREAGVGEWVAPDGRTFAHFSEALRAARPQGP